MKSDLRTSGVSNGYNRLQSSRVPMDGALFAVEKNLEQTENICYFSIEHQSSLCQETL